eukprot:362010-Chlamydomonas_euryale.AAC.7
MAIACTYKCLGRVHLLRTGHGQQTSLTCLRLRRAAVLPADTGADVLTLLQAGAVCVMAMVQLGVGSLGSAATSVSSVHACACRTLEALMCRCAALTRQKQRKLRP